MKSKNLSFRRPVVCFSIIAAIILIPPRLKAQDPLTTATTGASVAKGLYTAAK